MAETGNSNSNKNKTGTPASGKKKKESGRWFREMKGELKKITWPDRKTVLKNTGTVLLCSLIIGACIWIFDAVTINAVRMLISVFAS